MAGYDKTVLRLRRPIDLRPEYTRTGVEKEARRIILFCSGLERDSASHSFEEDSTMLKKGKALNSWILHKGKKEDRVGRTRTHTTMLIATSSFSKFVKRDTI